MISFIKSNLNILIPILILFFTFDTFFLIYKIYIKPIADLTISYDNFKSYYDNKVKLAVVNLTVVNNSTSSIKITGIKLTDGYKSYSATLPKMQDTHNKNEIDIDISSEKILKYTEISSHGVLNSYVFFENIELITETKNYKLVIETLSKTFKKKITISSINN